MAKLPVPQERVMFSGASFSTRSPGIGGGPLPLAQAMQQWSAKRREEIRQDALARVQDEATVAQQAYNAVGGNIPGVGRIAPPSDDLNREEAAVFEEQARAVFATKLVRDAAREAHRFAMEHPYDPDGYAQKYNAWMAPQVEALNKADPSAAVVVKDKLDGIGETRMRKIIEDAAGQAEETVRVEFAEGLSQWEAEYQDTLRANPDMDVLDEALTDLGVQLDEAVDTKSVSPSWAAEQKVRVRQNFRREYIRGVFFEALDQEVPDIKGAQGLIKFLNEGGMFDDNDYGREVASMLESELRSLNSAATKQHERRIDQAFMTLKNARSLQTHPDNPQRQQAEEAIQLYGDADDQRNYALWKNTQNYLDHLQISGAAASDADLQGLYAQVTNNPAMFANPEAAQDAIVARREQIAEAASSGNFLADTGVDLSSTPQEIQTQRVFAGARHDVTPDMIPYASPRLVSQAQEQYASAPDAGSAREVLERALAAVPTWDVTGRIATAGMLQGRLAGFGAASAIAPETAATLHDLAFNGKGMQGSRLSEMKEEYSEVAREEIIATAEVLGMGNVTVSDDMEVALTQALYQLGWDAKDSDLNVENEFTALLQPFTDTVEFSNGTFLPRQMVMPGEIEAVDARLEEFLERTGDVALHDALVPHPLSENQWGFRSRRSGRLIPSFEDDTRPFVVETREAVEQAVESELFDEAGLLSAATGGRTSNQQMLEIDLPRAAGATNGKPDLLQAIFKAGRHSRPGERYEQDFSMVWSRNNADVVSQQEYQAAYRKASRGGGDPLEQMRSSPLGITPVQTSQEPVPDPLRNTLGSAVYASLLLQKMLEKYGTEDNGDRALAAYLLGDDVIETLGDDWKKQVDPGVFQFIARVEGYL